jgi:uncharacterized membrane protein
MAIDTSELRKGISETWPFLLSHNLPSNFDRCYSFRLFGRDVHLCARCSGIYPGIFAGVLAFPVVPAAFTSVIVVALLPIPALVDWSVTAFTPRRGHNPVRTTTGLLLGYAYGLGLTHLFAGHDLRVLAIGVVYAVIAVLLITRESDSFAGDRA